jgi:cytochrome c biogenesis protein CcmG/thiol:disulfide interchange protein DsbE
MRSFSTPVGILMAGLLLAGCGGAASSAKWPSPPTTAAAPTAKVGAPLPDFTLTGIDGQPLRSSDLTGKPLVLNFWAGWCSACLQELPAFQTTAQQVPADQVKFLFVNFQDTPDTVKSYLSQLGFNQPVALDSRGDTAMKLNVLGLPTTFFVDAGGVLRSIHSGEITPDQLRADLQVLVPGITLASPEASAAAAASAVASPAPSAAASLAATVPSPVSKTAAGPSAPQTQPDYSLPCDC